MSEENRPNLNAAGLAVDILTAIRKRVRGKARVAAPSVVMALVSNLLVEFVENVNDALDEEFGG